MQEQTSEAAITRFGCLEAGIIIKRKLPLKAIRSNNYVLMTEESEEEMLLNTIDDTC